ncbi:MAG: hypothetical protein WCE75_01780 [Terracidiphilus sp.]
MLTAVCLAMVFFSVSLRAQQGEIKLTPAAKIRKGVDAWPLIAGAEDAASKRVNATLTRLNLTMRQSLKDCDASLLDSFKEEGRKPAGKNPVENDWTRTIEVTMAGPRFLSLVATDEADCGGAHPNSDTIAMVFDMTTGTPVNWLALVAKGAGAKAFVDSVIDGTKVGALILPGLKKINLAAAEKDCREAFLDPQSFQLWPDAKKGALIAEAFDLPNVVAACANPFALTAEQARGLGFDAALLAAIDAAHVRAAGH